MKVPRTSRRRRLALELERLVRERASSTSTSLWHGMAGRRTISACITRKPAGHVGHFTLGRRGARLLDARPDGQRQPKAHAAKTLCENHTEMPPAKAGGAGGGPSACAGRPPPLLQCCCTAGPAGEEVRQRARPPVPRHLRLAVRAADTRTASSLCLTAPAARAAHRAAHRAARSSGGQGWSGKARCAVCRDGARWPAWRNVRHWAWRAKSLIHPTVHCTALHCTACSA